MHSGTLVRWSNDKEQLYKHDNLEAFSSSNFSGSIDKRGSAAASISHFIAPLVRTYPHSSIVLLRFYLTELIYRISIAFHAIRVVARYHRYHQHFLLATDNVLSASAQWIISLKFVLSFEMYTLYMLFTQFSTWTFSSSGKKERFSMNFYWNYNYNLE